MKLNAYCKWLLKNGYRDRRLMADILRRDALQHNRATFDLLAETGDTEYNYETFLKVADLILKEDENIPR